MTADTRTIQITLRRERTVTETFTFTETVKLSELGLSAEDWDQEQARNYADNLVMAGNEPDGRWREGEIVNTSGTEVEDVTLEGEYT